MKNLKPTPQVALRLGGYNDMTRELRVIGGNDNPVPKDTTILMKNERPSKNCRFKIKNAGLKSSFRERCLPQSFEALNIRFKNFRFKKNLSLAKC